MYGIFLLNQWLVLIPIWVTPIASKSYGIQNYLYDHGAPPFLKDYTGITVTLPEKPAYKDGYLLAWAFYPRIVQNSNRCPTTASILRQERKDLWREIYSEVLKYNPIQHIVHQEVTSKLVVIRKGDILRISYDYILTCTEPIVSFTFSPTSETYRPENGSLIIEEGANIALNILISEFQQLEEKPRVNHLDSNLIQIQWNMKNSTDFTLHGYQLSLLSSPDQLIINRMVYGNTDYFHNLNHDVVYYATVQVVQRVNNHIAIDPIYSASSLFCTERRKIENCSPHLNELEQMQNSQRILEISYPGEVDICVTGWKIVYGISSDKPQTTSSLAGLNETIKFNISTRLAYKIAVQVTLPDNHTTEICKADFLYPESTSLRSKMPCFHNLLLSWDAADSHLLKNITYLVKCSTKENTSVSLQTTQNEALITKDVFEKEYNCSIQTKQFSNIYSQPSDLTVTLGVKSMGDINVLSDKSGYAVLYFKETVIPIGATTADNVTYKVLCEPFFFAEGRYSPIILNDVLDEIEYNCNITPTDKCGVKGQTMMFKFSTVRKQHLTWILVPIVSGLLLVSVLIGVYWYYFKLLRPSKISENPQLPSRNFGSHRIESDESLFQSSVYYHLSTGIERPYCRASEVPSSTDEYTTIHASTTKDASQVTRKRKKKRKRGKKKTIHNDLPVAEAL